MYQKYPPGLNCMKLEIIFHSRISTRTQTRTRNLLTEKSSSASLADSLLHCLCKLQQDENINSFSVHILFWQSTAKISCGNSSGKTDPIVPLGLLSMHTEFVKSCGCVYQKKFTVTAMTALSRSPPTIILSAQRTVFLAQFQLVVDEIVFSEEAEVHIKVTVGIVTLVKSAVALLPLIPCISEYLR